MSSRPIERLVTVFSNVRREGVSIARLLDLFLTAYDLPRLRRSFEGVPV